MAQPIFRGALAKTRATVTDLEFIGQDILPNGLLFEGTTLGGLSAITFDARFGLYYALSDDRSQFSPARFYTLDIDLADGMLDTGDVSLTDVTTLRQQDRTPYAPFRIDPEGLTIDFRGRLFLAQEGQVAPIPQLNGEQIEATVARIRLGGREVEVLSASVDPKFLPTTDGSSGIRNNLAYESLTVTPNGSYLYAATENALFQDGPAATLDSGSLARILKIDASTGETVAEYAYITDQIARMPGRGGFATNGLVELLALDDNGTLLAMERSFSDGARGTVGNTGYDIKIYLVQTQGATDISGIFSIETEIDQRELVANLDTPVRKELLFDLADLGIPLDNIEGMTLGERLPDGRQTLILVSDNNFNPAQITQVLAFAIETETIPVIRAKVETPDTLRYELPDPTEGPDSDDPAIWANPLDGADSTVITTFKNGGLGVYDLAGQELQRIEPADIRYNNVDVLYNVSLGGMLVDIAVASDRANDTLAIFSIDPLTRLLTDITASTLSDPAFSIFGVDDGEATAYGLAGYTSPIDGSHYVFVTQADGAQIAQLRITDAGGGKAGATLVRMLDLPVAPGEDPADYQSEGISIDRETGIGYVTVEDELGLLAFEAEPTGSKRFDVVADIDFEAFVPDLEGVAILYGRKGNGALVVSSQGDSSFAVFDRRTWEYKGSFAIGDGRAIDAAEGCDGLEIYSGALGDAFPRGLLVAHDGSNVDAHGEPTVIVTPDDGEVQNYNSNFKYVDLRDLAKALGIRLGDRGYDPRDVPDALLDSPFGG
jgi:myo-inositol-hexaphosphate 3-phosphohydrolase